MFKNVVRKIFYIAQLTAGLGLGLFFPLWFLLTRTGYSVPEALFVYVMLVVVAQVGVLLFRSAWRKLEMKGVTTE